MSYARWSDTCPWYVYATGAEDVLAECQLAIEHVSGSPFGRCVKFKEVALVLHRCDRFEDAVAALLSRPTDSRGAPLDSPMVLAEALRDWFLDLSIAPEHLPPHELTPDERRLALQVLANFCTKFGVDPCWWAEAADRALGRRPHAPRGEPTP